MSSPKTISLNHKDLYDLGGKTFTLRELQDAVIKAKQRDEIVQELKEGKFLIAGGK